MHLDIPASLDCLDQDCYAPGGALGQGVPTDAFLGRRAAEQDRKLHSISRRAWGDWYPDPAGVSGAVLPQICDVVGTEVVAEEIEITPGTQWLDWYIRGEAPAGQVLYAVAWAEGPHSPQPFLTPPCPQAVQILGTGARANYGPISCRVRAGAWLVGLTVWSQTRDVTPVAQGAVLGLTDRSIRGAAGVFAGLASPPAMGICLTDGVGAAVPPISGLYQLIRAESSGIAGAAADLAVCHPPTVEQDRRGYAAGALGWKMWRLTTLSVSSWYMRERQLTGSLETAP